LVASDIGTECDAIRSRSAERPAAIPALKAGFFYAREPATAPATSASTAGLIARAASPGAVDLAEDECAFDERGVLVGKGFGVGEAGDAPALTKPVAPGVNRKTLLLSLVVFTSSCCPLPKLGEPET